MVWQVSVPGTQIVTLVCRILREPLTTGPMLIGWTLGVVDCTTLAGMAGSGVDAAEAGDALLAGPSPEPAELDVPDAPEDPDEPPQPERPLKRTALRTPITPTRKR